jgi:hypothetical protein
MVVFHGAMYKNPHYKQVSTVQVTPLTVGVKQENINHATNYRARNLHVHNFTGGTGS